MIKDIKIEEVKFEYENGATFNKLHKIKSQEQLGEIAEVCFLSVKGLPIHAYVSVEETSSGRMGYGMTFNLVDFENEDEWDNYLYIGVRVPSMRMFYSDYEWKYYLKQLFVKTINNKKWAKQYRLEYATKLKEEQDA